MHSMRYGAHLSKEEVAELVAPHRDTLEIVHSWLEHHGVPSSSISTSHGGGWLTITSVPVSQADELLGASYQLYRHTGSNETGAILRTVGYSLPAVLHEHVQTVAPTTHFASPRRPRQIRRSKEAEVAVNATSGELVRELWKRDGYVTPPFLRWLYKTQTSVPPTMTRNSLGALGFQDDYPNQADLTQFMNNFREDAQSATFVVVPVNGGRYDPSTPGVGGSLQTQYAEAMAYPTPFKFYSTGGDFRWSSRTYKPVRGDGYLEWLNYLLALPNFYIPPTVIISYSEPELTFPLLYARSLCVLFAQLGTRGVSVIVASGDDGVGVGDCINHRRTVWFAPVFPATCPWVTTVGGTTSHSPEVAAFFSGGGFSRHFRRPSYQTQNGMMADFFVTLGDTYSGYYQRTGRGFPDIAAQAQRFVYLRNTLPYELSGTICSATTVAGIFSLLNGQRLSAGRRSLGFLNPWLYSSGLAGLRDITSGSNPGCGTPGFSAVAGWDPVTGLGTPDFEALLPQALAPFLGHGV